MSIPRRYSLLSLLLSLIFAPLAGAVEPSCLLRVGWEEWYPMVHEQNGQLQGIEHALVSKLAASAGCQLRFIEMPWTRSQQELKGGRIDMLYGASKTAERAAFAVFSPPYRIERIVMVIRASDAIENPQISLRQWLGKKRPNGQLPVLGLALGYYYGANLEPIIRAPELAERRLEVRWDQKLQEMLQFDRIDGFLVEASVANEMVAHRPGQFRLLAVTDHQPDPMHLMFSQAVDPAIVARFAEAIRKSSGK